MKPFRFRPNVALADIAFFAYGKTLGELLENACLAVTAVMVDPEKIKEKTERRIEVLGDTAETLLYNSLEEVVYLKDAEQLVFHRFEAEVIREKPYEAVVTMWGEKIDRKKHDAHADVKGITYHDFHITKTKMDYRASVVLDV